VSRSISRLSTSRWGPCAMAGTMPLVDHLSSVAPRAVATPAEGTKAPAVR
jgi:hypothetical protein